MWDDSLDATRSPNNERSQSRGIEVLASRVESDFAAQPASWLGLVVLRRELTLVKVMGWSVRICDEIQYNVGCGM